MTKRKKTYYRYSICFKEKVVHEVSGGASITEVCLRYGIKGTNTVQRWIERFGQEELLNTEIRIEMKGERDRLKELETEVRSLKIAVAEKTMALDAMEKLVEIASAHYRTDIKKNSDRNS
ncbi:MAG: transposase [Tannerella sp.]|jgi:transposase-like protein|nr:transposase [Tannerella sp.]